MQRDREDDLAFRDIPELSATKVRGVICAEKMEERVVRIVTELAVLQRLNGDSKWVYGSDIEKAYRRRFRQPSQQVLPTLTRLKRSGKLIGNLVARNIESSKGFLIETSKGIKMNRDAMLDRWAIQKDAA